MRKELEDKINSMSELDVSILEKLTEEFESKIKSLSEPSLADISNFVGSSVEELEQLEKSTLNIAKLNYAKSVVLDILNEFGQSIAKTGILTEDESSELILFLREEELGF